ncbi:unnamed protein product [Paramecium sonneborni]|uniref:Uncharacterized protein n=1 Tax=Paramecium sonneborni TaxID=65129 RepID=A0A8S1MPX3_9CILI|nr:unnamed protein product [Paramecium sonneborni]
MIKEGETFRQKQLKLKEIIKEREDFDAKRVQIFKINPLQQPTLQEEQQKEIIRKCNKELQITKKYKLYYNIQGQKQKIQARLRININGIERLIEQRNIYELGKKNKLKKKEIEPQIYILQ